MRGLLQTQKGRRGSADDVLSVKAPSKSASTENLSPLEKAFKNRSQGSLDALGSGSADSEDAAASKSVSPQTSVRDLKAMWSKPDDGASTKPAGTVRRSSLFAESTIRRSSTTDALLGPSSASGGSGHSKSLSDGKTAPPITPKPKATSDRRVSAPPKQPDELKTSSGTGTSGSLGLGEAPIPAWKREIMERKMKKSESAPNI